jgi:hypothetical protein
MTDFAGVSTHDGLRRVFVGIKDDILSNRLVHRAKQPASLAIAPGGLARRRSSRTGVRYLLSSRGDA